MTDTPRPDEGTIPEEHLVLMMGHLDGELGPEDDARFRGLLEGSPGLRAELVRYRRLADLADSVKLREPQDYEWERFHRELLQRLERRTGGILLAVGLVVLVGAGLFELWRRALLPPLVLGGLTALVAGLLVLFLHTLRGRLRTLRYDRYREVRR